MDKQAIAVIKPWKIKDRVTEDTVKVSVSQYYSKLTINNRTYYFDRESGAFDGTSTNF
jgi:hypothetical protein